MAADEAAAEMRRVAGLPAGGLVRRVESAPMVTTLGCAEGETSVSSFGGDYRSIAQSGHPRGAAGDLGGASRTLGLVRRTDSYLSMCSSASGGLLGMPRVGSEFSVCSALDEDDVDDVADESTGYGSDSATPPWRLIWCQERCHKSDQESWRRALSQAASERGAVLHCLKKGSKFAAWLAHARARYGPFALLTDWREAKPCMQALKDLNRQAAVTVLLCPHPGPGERASAWARGMRERNERVFVEQIPDAADLGAFVERLGGWISREEVGGLSPRRVPGPGGGPRAELPESAPQAGPPPLS